MSTLNKIRIQGFRRLLDVELPLQPLNVLVGPNGCGKTTLLDVFRLLSASANGELAETLSEMGGVAQNLSNVAAPVEPLSRSMAFEVTLPGPESGFRYRLALSAQGQGFQISDETLRMQPLGSADETALLESYHGDVRVYVAGAGLQPPVPGLKSTNESALSRLTAHLVPHANEYEYVRSRLMSSAPYHSLDVSSRAPIRLPQQTRDAHLPGANGEYLVACLMTLRELFPDNYAQLESTLRAGFPTFERLIYPSPAAGMLSLMWKESTSREPFYIHQLSEGTLRFLWLSALLHSPSLPPVTLIDEPEVSLHPELLSLLVDLMREASQRTQLVVATHSDRLIRFLKPEEVVTINMNEDGSVSMARADQLDLGQWLEEYTLDEVWRLGRMGARP